MDKGEEEQQVNGKGRQQVRLSVCLPNTYTPTPWHSFARRKSHAVARL
jgi:hypothetical protein